MKNDLTFDGLVGILNYIVDNVLLLAGLIALGAVIWYGFQIVIARGDPKKFTEARDALTKAFIGMLVIFGVYTIINTLQGAAETLTR